VKEINILGECNCPSIVRYIGCYAKENLLWIVMEYCAGGSVRDAFKLCKKTLTEDQVSAICACVVDGLAYLHSHKVLHRDIKASNILLCLDGQAKLADFGVSVRLMRTASKRVSVVGSPHWMAPEILKSDHGGYDNKADVWSLGITTIELAQGVPPYYDLHPARAILKIPDMKEPPPNLKDPHQWSHDIQDFIAQCLNKDPTKRATAQQLLEHPFIVRGKTKKHLTAQLVRECLPILEEKRLLEIPENFDSSLTSIGGSKLGSLCRGMDSLTQGGSADYGSKF